LKEAVQVYTEHDVNMPVCYIKYKGVHLYAEAARFSTVLVNKRKNIGKPGYTAKLFEKDCEKELASLRKVCERGEKAYVSPPLMSFVIKTIWGR
jgi:hypothetical protein